MRAEDRLIIELCKRNGDAAARAALATDRRLDWGYLLGAISRHMVAPAVLERLCAGPLPPDARPLLAARLAEEVAEVMRRRRTFTAELSKIRSALEGIGVPWILMKGLALDFDGLRVTCDIDILVRGEDLDRVLGAIGKAGYSYIGAAVNRALTAAERRNIELQKPWNNQYQLLNPATGAILEVHTNLFERRRVYAIDLDPLLDGIGLFWEARAYDRELGCHVLAPEHHLLLMCLHNAIKRSPADNRFSLRSLVDIDRLIGRGIRWEAVVWTSLELKIAPFISFSLRMAERFLASGTAQAVLALLEDGCTRWQRRLVTLHERCATSLGDSPLFYAKLYGALSPFAFGGRWPDRLKWLFLIPILAPPRHLMAQRFRVRASSPLIFLTYLLNPFRWVWLIARDLARAAGRTSRSRQSRNSGASPELAAIDAPRR